jgi:transcriptional regulator GlxA family with amidase domain
VSRPFLQPAISLRFLPGARLWRQAAESYCRVCLAHRTAPQVKELAVQLRLSPDQLSRAFIGTTGTPLSTFFARLRLDEAKRLLDETDLPVTGLPDRVGFENERTFLRFFKRETGLRPAEYRERARNVSRPVTG